MTDLAKDSAATSAIDLLTHYGFDQGEQTAKQLVGQWLQTYPIQWLRLAVVEALYQGRYKAISVEQILAFWQRRGQALYHFNHEFERLICNRFPEKLSFTKQKSEEQRLAKVVNRRPVSKVTPQENSTVIPANLASQEETLPPQTSTDSSNLAVEPPSQVEVASANLLEVALKKKGGRLLLEPLQPEDLASYLSFTKVTNSMLAFESATTPAKLDKANTYQTNWPPLRKDPIHPLIPSSESSGFCTKLTAIALADRNQGRSLPQNHSA